MIAGVAVATVAGGAAWWMSGKREGEGKGERAGEERGKGVSPPEPTTSEPVAQRLGGREEEREESAQRGRKAEEKIEAYSTSAVGEASSSHSDVSTMPGAPASRLQEGAVAAASEAPRSEERGGQGAEVEREAGEAGVREATTTPLTKEVSEAVVKGGESDVRVRVREAASLAGERGAAGGASGTAADRWQALRASERAREREREREREGARAGGRKDGDAESGRARAVTGGVSEGYVASLMLRTAEEARRRQAGEDEREWRRREDELQVREEG